MRVTSAVALRFLAFACAGWSFFSSAQEPVKLVIKPNGSRMDLSWPAKMVLPSGDTIFPGYEIQRSVDLLKWETVGGLYKAGSRQALETLQSSLDNQGQQAFYRIVANADPVRTATGGADVYGYSSVFKMELSRLGQLTVPDFSDRYGTRTNYLSQLSWDPTTAQYWYAYDPQNSSYTGPNGRLTNDFRLNPAELTVFKTNGFVVSERLGSYSFADCYYKLLSDDLPVFVSTDAILHAWHRSFNAMLEELEETFFWVFINQMMDGMAAKIPATWSQYGQGPLKDSILDADYYLTVARSLLAGSKLTSSLNQDARVATALTAITNLQLQDFILFGSNRTVDFSQFTVRGHYDASERLRRYFRAMIWCGRIDLRVTKPTSDDIPEDYLRQLGTAIVLNSLLKQSAQTNSWRQMDQALQTLVGTTDSMTFAQLDDILTAANIQSLADLPELAALQRVQADIMAGDLGFQDIRSDFYFSPLGPAQLKLPRSFTVMGQKFVLDSWALAKVVYDDILWDGGKVMRRIPSCLDVAFSVFKNDDVVPDIVARIVDPNGRKFRDGLPYQHNLAAVRNVMDSQTAAVWESNLYMNWLAVLRDLSDPTTGSQFPEAMHTRAWAMKNLNTQMASWTQLRHDTLLYAKQSYTAGVLCSYPAGFVEPRTNFWARMQKLALITASKLNLWIQVPEIYVPGRDSSGGGWVSLGNIRQSQLAFLQKFASNMGVLQGISQKELKQEPLALDEVNFLKDVIQNHTNSYFGTRLFDGWFPQLHYRNIFIQDYPLQTQLSDKWDPLVADVHTDVPAPLVDDPGCVLHEGVGNVHMLIIAVDNGPDRMIYAGPVLSHYEFEVPGIARKSDTDWKSDIKAGKLPPNPDWTKSYLVPGTISLPAWLQ